MLKGFRNRKKKSSKSESSTESITTDGAVLSRIVNSKDNILEKDDPSQNPTETNTEERNDTLKSNDSSPLEEYAKKVAKSMEEVFKSSNSLEESTENGAVEENIVKKEYKPQMGLLRPNTHKEALSHNDRPLGTYTREFMDASLHVSTPNPDAVQKEALNRSTLFERFLEFISIHPKHHIPDNRDRNQNKVTIADVWNEFIEYEFTTFTEASLVMKTFAIFCWPIFLSMTTLFYLKSQLLQTPKGHHNSLHRYVANIDMDITDYFHEGRLFILQMGILLLHIPFTLAQEMKKALSSIEERVKHDWKTAGAEVKKMDKKY